MRNSILAISIAFVVAASCTAFAGEKISVDHIQKKHVGNIKWTGAQSQLKAPTTTPAGITGLTAKGTLGGSTGPTKPTLPTTGTQHR